jgi:hypothetical protein
LYIRLESPAIDVKLYSDDLEQFYQCEFSSDRNNTALTSENKQHQFLPGQVLSLRTENYDQRRKRWLLRPV